jgi:ubiquinone biosynthesis protein
MNAWGFLRLMREIYGHGLPDLEAIQRQGLLAVKIGQTFALRIDFLDEARCAHLARLYRRAAEVPAEDLRRLLGLHTDASWRARFRRIDDVPLAAASIGQVHRAELTDGTPVVVKVVKGDFTARFVRDVRDLRRLMRLAVALYPTLRRVADPVGILSHIEEYTLQELDFRNEIRHGRILRRIAEEHRGRYDLSALAFPGVHEDLSGEHVLVTEFIDGRTLDELLERGTLDYETLLELFRIHGFYMFAVGTFHGDIHPGNVILKGGRLYFVDTGALSHAGERIRRGLFAFFEALTESDYPACARALNRMAERGIEGAAWAAFERDFLTLYRDFTGSTVRQVSLTRRMMETIKLGVRAGMEFEPGMYPIIKSLMYLDGMVLKCRPDAVLMRDMRPMIGAFKRVMGSPSLVVPHAGSGAG